MPTPEGINLVPLHGLFVEPDEDGTPLQGTVSFTPTPAVITFPDQNTIMAGTETVTLDVNGEFTINLPCTDTDNQVPDGWGYAVQEKLLGLKPRAYFILLPYTSGATVELADITPTDAAPTYIPVVGPQGPPGFVNSVNGIHEIDIVLTAANVGAIATTARGAVNGVASLDGTTKVPAAQLPDLSAVYLAVGTRGAANGVASLGAGGLVPSTQLDLADTAALAVADAGAIGVSTQLAREDHVHAGVNLTTTQSAAGAKTWTGSAYFTGTEVGVGVSASLAGRVDFRTASAAQTILNLQNTSGASTAALFKINGDTSTSVLMVSLVTGDAQNRFALRGSGQLEFGPGSGARDVNFYRSAVGILNSSGQFASDAATPTAISHLTRKDYVDTLDGANVKLTGAQSVGGVKTFSSTPIFTPGITVSGAAALNAGGASSSTNAFTFTRTSGAGEAVRVTNSTATGVAIRAQVTAYATDRILTGQLSTDTVDPFSIYGDGQQQWGPGGSTARDVTLARTGAGLLTVTGSLAMTGVGNVQFIRKAADTGRTVTAVADDPHLTANVIAGATYEVSGTLFLATTDTANADFTMVFNVPASSLGYWNVIGQNQGATADFGGVRAVPTGWGTATRTLGAFSADNAGIVVTGIIRATASGAFTLQWCRAGASGTITLLADSFMKLTRVA